MTIKLLCESSSDSSISEEESQVVTYVDGEITEVNPLSPSLYDLEKARDNSSDFSDHDDFDNCCELYPVDPRQVPCGWYKDGRKATKEFLQNGIEDGEWTFFSMGYVERRGQYKAGKRKGFWDRQGLQEKSA